MNSCLDGIMREGEESSQPEKEGKSAKQVFTKPDPGRRLYSAQTDSI